MKKALDRELLERLTSVAWVTAVVATVNSVVRPAALGIKNSALAGWMIAQRNLVFWSRHIRATISGIMYFMITICLLVFVDNVVRHSIPSFFQYENSVLCFY